MKKLKMEDKNFGSGKIPLILLLSQKYEIYRKKGNADPDFYFIHIFFPTAGYF